VTAEEIFASICHKLDDGTLEEQIQRETELRSLILADEYEKRAVRQLKELRSSYPAEGDA